MPTLPKILAPSGTYLSGVPDADIARKIRFGGRSEDYSVYNTSTQQYESAKTGKPWHGKVVGGYAINGKFSSKPSPDMPPEPGAEPVQFTVTKTVKQPEIATATAGTLANQQKVATQTATGFQDFLNQAREINAQNKTQLAKDQAAFDTSKIESQLPAINADYRAGQEGVTSDIVTRNKDYAQQTQDLLNRLSDANKTYAANAQAVADQAYQKAMKRNSLYQLASGTPTSASGAATNRAIKAYADINTPLQRELADRAYSQLVNVERPFQRELYGNDMGVYNRESGLLSDFANRDEATAKYLQNLKMQVAGMSRQQAMSYLNSLGVPLELGQRLISGDIANLSNLQRLDEASNYYTVQTPFDPSRLPPVQSFPLSYPTRTDRPSVPSFSTGGIPTANVGAQAPVGDSAPPILGYDKSSWDTPQLRLMRQAAAKYGVSSPGYLDNPHYNYGTTGGGYIAPEGTRAENETLAKLGLI